MLLIPVLIAGLLLGWAASILFKARYYHEVILNLIVGMAGGLASGVLFAPILGRPSIISGDFSVGAFIFSLLGSAILLGLVFLVRRFGMR